MCALGAVGAAWLRRRDCAWSLAAAAAALRFWPGSGRSLRDKVVVIAGGSRGLGLALADRALREGARVALLARDGAELSRAKDLLGPRALGHTLLLRCDVTDKADVDDAVSRVREAWNRLDVWINNAGTITVGPFVAMGRAEFDAMLDLSVHAIVLSTKALLPVFRRQRRGHIVNICSVGGKFGVPHLSAYTTGKFALAGLSQVLGAELARDRIEVTTVYPAVMRVGSTVQGTFKGNAEKEYAWFTTTSTLPGLSVNAERAAARIIEAVRQREVEVVFPAVARCAVLGSGVFPELAALVRRVVARFLPVGDSRVGQSGGASRHWLESRLWFRPLRAVARGDRARWNQWEAADDDETRRQD